MAVAELEKRNDERCCHVGNGCTIYDSRPSSCREWKCNWLLGLIGRDERRRPDKLGLVLTFELRGGKYLLTAYEVWEGAAREPKASYLLQKLGRTMPIILVRPSNLFEVLSPDAEQREQLTAIVANGATASLEVFSRKQPPASGIRSGRQCRSEGFGRRLNKFRAKRSMFQGPFRLEARPT
jgi:hypothetical protein